MGDFRNRPGSGDQKRILLVLAAAMGFLLFIAVYKFKGDLVEDNVVSINPVVEQHRLGFNPFTRMKIEATEVTTVRGFVFHVSDQVNLDIGDTVLIQKYWTLIQSETDYVFIENKSKALIQRF